MKMNIKKVAIALLLAMLIPLVPQMVMANDNADEGDCIIEQLTTIFKIHIIHIFLREDPERISNPYYGCIVDMHSNSSDMRLYDDLP